MTGDLRPLVTGSRLSHRFGVDPMTPWQNRADELTLRMAQDMKLRNFSQRTIDAYT